MRKSLLFAIYLLGSAMALPSSYQGQVYEAGTFVPREPVRLRAPIQDKNFYLLSLLESTPSIANMLARYSVLASITDKKLSSEAVCNVQIVGCIDAATFSAEEIASVTEQLLETLRKEPEMRTNIVASMRRSGFFELYASENDTALLSHAWTDAAQGINRILAVYGKGQPPRYPKIDSSSFDLTSVSGREVLGTFSTQIAATNSSHTLIQSELWFQPSLQLALFLLEINHRDEAGRFEPLDRGENAKALARLEHIEWNKYPYSVIVVPGLGPEQDGVALDPGGLMRVAIAAKHYRAGLAPFILVTGGYVHPSQTPFCEAIEMRRALIAKFGIPADAIFIEPHARHTTTNLRNASRLMYRYRVPLDRPALISTDEAQTRSIRSAEFVRRNKEELGYLPFRNLKPVSSTDTAFSVEINSLQANSSDPLDP